jgi:hypothetical protein
MERVPQVSEILDDNGIIESEPMPLSGDDLGRALDLLSSRNQLLEDSRSWIVG